MNKSQLSRKMSSVSVAWLRSVDACESQVEIFSREFGAEATITRSNLDRATQLGLNLDWLARRILTAPALAEYDRVKAQALPEYDRVKAQAWAEYNRVKAQAWAEYNRVTAPALADALGLLP